MIKQYDLIVIGGGPAGYGAAVRGAQLGASVLLVEKEAIGGTCLNWGCIPTKFLWESLHLKKKLSRAQDYGISVEVKGLDFNTLWQKKTKTVEQLVKGLSALLKSYAIEAIEGTATVSKSKEVQIKQKSGESVTVKSEKIVIAAGSRPANLKILSIDHNKIIDSTDILNLKELPKTLLVIGGGPIGVELAGVMAGMGCEVKLVEKEPQLLPSADAELAQEVKKLLERQSVKVITGAGSLDEHINAAEKVLLATGRKPNIEELGLEAAGIKYSNKGIETNDFLETSVKGIYAAGDVTGRSLLAYIAQAEGVAAAENALKDKKSKLDYSVIPWAVFSDPPAAGVGAKESDFKPEDISVGKFQLAASGRATIEAERAGWVKVICEKKTGKLLGGSIVGPGAEEIIPILTLAIQNKLAAKDLSREIFFHPSISEALHNACEDAFGKCIDLPKKTK